MVSKSDITQTNWKNTHTKTNYKLQYWSGVHSMVVPNIYSTSLFQDMNSTAVVARGMKTQWTESERSQQSHKMRHQSPSDAAPHCRRMETNCTAVKAEKLTSWVFLHSSQNCKTQLFYIMCIVSWFLYN